MVELGDIYRQLPSMKEVFIKTAVPTQHPPTPPTTDTKTINATPSTTTAPDTAITVDYIYIYTTNIYPLINYYLTPFI